jgi:5-methylcytosine-specific restriction endonuclease McrA
MRTNEKTRKPIAWRKTREYRYWRVAVIRRDKACIVCGSRKRRQAHHIKNGSHHASERFNIANGATLCYKCHMNYHTNFNRSYRVKTTLYNFKNFQSLVKYLKGVL